MKKLLLLTTLIVAALSLPVLADATKLEGEAVCAKCKLKVADKCQAVIQVTDAEGKKVNYFTEAGDKSGELHDEICKGGKPVTAEGDVTEKDGKKMIKVTKYEVRKP